MTTFNFTNRGNILAVFQALDTKPDFRDKLNMYDETGLNTSQESLSKKLSKWSKSKEIECFKDDK